jgi:hypothetical protein
MANINANANVNEGNVELDSNANLNQQIRFNSLESTSQRLSKYPNEFVNELFQLSPSDRMQLMIDIQRTLNAEIEGVNDMTIEGAQINQLGRTAHQHFVSCFKAFNRQINSTRPPRDYVPTKESYKQRVGGNQVPALQYKPRQSSVGPNVNQGQNPNQGQRRPNNYAKQSYSNTN